MTKWLKQWASQQMLVTSKQTSNLARLRISHSAIMGETELKGKKVNMEVVSGGHFKLEVPDSSTVYAPQIKIRTFLQRFMYKRFIKGSGNIPNRFVKTVMGESLYVDLQRQRWWVQLW